MTLPTYQHNCGSLSGDLTYRSVVASLPYFLRIRSKVLAAIRSGFVPLPVYPETVRDWDVEGDEDDDDDDDDEPNPPPLLLLLFVPRFGDFANKPVG